MKIWDFDVHGCLIYGTGENGELLFTVPFPVFGYPTASQLSRRICS